MKTLVLLILLVILTGCQPRKVEKQAFTYEDFKNYMCHRDYSTWKDRPPKSTVKNYREYPPGFGPQKK